MIRYFFKSVFRILFVLGLTIGVAECKPIQVLSGGSVSDGLDLAHIRIGEHNEYTRIVFEVKYWKGYGASKAGRSSDTVGHYKFTLDQDHTIEAVFSGFRSGSANETAISGESRVQSVKRLKGEAYGDDSTVFYQIRLRHASRLKVFHLYDPARIVLDISTLSP